MDNKYKKFSTTVPLLKYYFAAEKGVQDNLKSLFGGENKNDLYQEAITAEEALLDEKSLSATALEMMLSFLTKDWVESTNFIRLLTMTLLLFLISSLMAVFAINTYHTVMILVATTIIFESLEVYQRFQTELWDAVVKAVKDNVGLNPTASWLLGADALERDYQPIYSAVEGMPKSGYRESLQGLIEGSNNPDLIGVSPMEYGASFFRSAGSK